MWFAFLQFDETRVSGELSAGLDGLIREVSF